MKILDITRPLFESDIIYPGDPAPSYRQEDRGSYLISELCLSSHSGTHIDAPAHYLKRGDTIDTVRLLHLVGRCRVLDMRKAGSTINASSLAGRVSGIKRLLLKTYFSGATCFDTDYPCFTPDAARFLSGNGMLCVGIDSPSVEALHSDGTVHRELLGHGCVIIELLDLENVREGDYIMAALPLRLAGLDGSPARVILIDRKRVP